MSRNPEFDVVVTAGGTLEKIDDVRYIGNFSSGRFGLSLADVALRMGKSVALIAPKVSIERFGLPKGATHMPFVNTDDLQACLLGIDSAGLVLHSAAVSDYRPIRTYGKISSNQETLTITCERTPKILPLLRPHFGPETTIVGFKLLSGVPVDDLLITALDQTEKNDTDYCVANLLDDINGDTRTVHVVDRHRRFANTLSGPTLKVSRKLVRMLLKGNIGRK